MKIHRLAFACASILLLAPACGSDDGSDDGSSAEGSSGSSGASTSGTAGTSSASGSASAATGEESAGSGGAEGSTSGGGSSGGGETSPSGCAMYDEQLQCAMAGCVPVVGSEYEMMGDMWCLGVRALIECQEDMGQNCEPTVTVACDPNGAQYSFPNTCLPAGWMECDPPIPDAPACG